MLGFSKTNNNSFNNMQTNTAEARQGREEDKPHRV
jgi:hypothetical protein